MGNGSPLEIVSDGRSLVVALVGDIDLWSRDEVWLSLVVLLRAPRDNVVIDLSAATFMDSRGIAVLMRAKRLLGDGCALTLRNPSSSVWRSLQVLGLDGSVRVDFDSKDQDTAREIDGLRPVGA